MTRPGIVRADTIDLQDHNSPSAQDHSRKPLGKPNGIAGPHQAAELRHVQTERAAEEVALSNAWGNGHGLSEEPPSEDDDVYMNGGHVDGDTLLPQDHNNGEDDMDDDGDDGMDDDGMDKMSSSPSISDGGSPSLLWPRRSSSLTPVPSRLGTPNREESGDVHSSVTSSPLSNRAKVGKASDSERRPQLPSSPMSAISNFAQSCSGSNGEDDDLSSPFTSSPDHSSLFQPSSFREHHHQCGEYMESANWNDPEPTTGLIMDISFMELSQAIDNKDRDKIIPLVMEDLDVFVGTTPSNKIRAGPLEKSPSDLELEEQLLPIHDPLLDFLKIRNVNTVGKTLTTSTGSEFETLPLSPIGSAISEAVSLLFGNESDASDSSDWTTDSDEDDDSFDSFTFNDDDAKSFQSSLHPLYFCSGWSGECLQEIEDIDFEFVYALHNFVATVEGQANAAKGDTMVLLDDSNSYWWLVRVVKDSTIGYLPAEHIETPTERLARLNKHRNIDACKMMYEDTLEKPKNPLRRAMRRRGQKQVTFTDPTYRDAPVYDWSSEEEDGEEGDMAVNGAHEDGSQNGTDHADDEDEITASNGTANGKAVLSQNGQELQDDLESESTLRASEESFEKRTRNGTVRNTDSFFKDDTIETKKISLTPKLLSDDSGSTTTVWTTDTVKERASSSFDLDKSDRLKEDKKKEKKGVLSIFKRSKKDKKSKYMDTDAISSRTSSEVSRESPVQEAPLQRKNSKGKLQKTPNPQAQAQAQVVKGLNGTNAVQPLEQNTNRSVTEAISESNSRPRSPEKPAPIRLGGVRTPTGDGSVRSPTTQPITSILSKPFQAQASPTQHLDTNGRLSESPVHVTAADAEPPALVRDSDDSDDVRSYQETPSPQMPGTTLLDTSHIERQATSGMHHSPISPTSPQLGIASGIPSALSRMAPQQPARNAPVQPNGSSPLMNFPTSSQVDRNGSTSTTTSTPSTPVWSDASLRAYLDESGTSDIRDLLLLTRDTTGLVPVSADHPLMAGLYLEERGKLKELDATLDGLLGTWLEKRITRSKSQQGLRK